MRELPDYPSTCRTVFFDWGVGNTYGWGIVGYNLLKFGGDSGRYRPVPTQYPMRFLERLDPVEERVLSGYSELLEGSRQFGMRSGDLFLRCIGLDAVPPLMDSLPGPQIGVPFIESGFISPEHVQLLNRYDGHIPGSYWARSVLTEHGVERVKVVQQGVDTDLFRYAPKRLFRDRFVIFSGGQLSRRKSQDIVVAALKNFLQRHPDALLICAWRSHWEEKWIAELGRCGELVEPIRVRSDTDVSIREWLSNNGISEKQVWVVGHVSHERMPALFWESDVALFPNRCEAGTNLLAQEALACQVPTLLSANTGHLDILDVPGAIALREQRPVPDRQGWFESSVEEILSQLERLYFRKRWASNGGGSLPTWKDFVERFCSTADTFSTENLPDAVGSS